MLYVYKLCKDNNIAVLNIANILNISRQDANRRLLGTRQFTIQELYLLKDNFIKKNIIDKYFDMMYKNCAGAKNTYH